MTRARQALNRATESLHRAQQAAADRQRELYTAQGAHGTARTTAAREIRQEVLDERQRRAPVASQRMQDARQRVPALQAESQRANDDAIRAVNHANFLRDQLRQQGTNLRTSTEYQQALRDARAAERHSQRTSMDAYNAEVTARRAEDQLISGRITEERISAHPAVRSASQQARAAASRINAANDAVVRARDRYLAAQTRMDRAQAARDAVRAGAGPVVRYGYDAAGTKSTKSAIKSTFGHQLSQGDLAKLTGAKQGDRINVSSAGTNAISVDVRGASHEGNFIVSRRSNGEVVIHSTYVRNTGTKTGASGRNVVGSFKDIASLGVNKLEASAAKGSSYNGYYTWAKLGFTGTIPPSVFTAAQRQFGNVTEVEQIISQPGGAAWWKAHGEAWHATFDFSPGSYSMRTLSKYQRNHAG